MEGTCLKNKVLYLYFIHFIYFEIASLNQLIKDSCTSIGSLHEFENLLSDLLYSRVYLSSLEIPFCLQCCNWFVQICPLVSKLECW